MWKTYKVKYKVTCYHTEYICVESDDELNTLIQDVGDALDTDDLEYGGDYEVIDIGED